MVGLRDIYQTVATTNPGDYNRNHQADLLQDGVALVTIASPIIIAVGFFFTLKAKTMQLESMIAELTKSFRQSLDNAHDILLLKIDAKLIVFSERMDVLRCEIKENQDDVKELEREIKKMQHARQDILNQLSKMGIDLYMIGDRDRRHRGDDDTLS